MRASLQRQKQGDPHFRCKVAVSSPPSENAQPAMRITQRDKAW